MDVHFLVPPRLSGQLTERSMNPRHERAHPAALAEREHPPQVLPGNLGVRAIPARRQDTQDEEAPGFLGSPAVLARVSEVPLGPPGRVLEAPTKEKAPAAEPESK